MTSNFLANVPKLKGRSNYNQWEFAMENFLILDGLNKAINGEEQDETKIAQAKSKLVLSIDPSLYVHIKSSTNAKEIWDILKKMFDDTGFSRRISLLRTLISARLDDSETMKAYVTHVIQTAQKLQGTGFKIDDEWIGSLLLAGLPTPKYTPMIMAIEHSGVKISSDLIKTKLIDAESASEFDDAAAFASKRVDDRKSKLPKCFQCGEFGHKQAQCTVKRKQNE